MPFVSASSAVVPEKTRFSTPRVVDACTGVQLFTVLVALLWLFARFGSNVKADTVAEFCTVALHAMVFDTESAIKTLPVALSARFATGHCTVEPTTAHPAELCPETKFEEVNPEGKASLTVIPVAVCGPLFFTKSVKRIVPPVATVAGADFVILGEQLMVVVQSLLLARRTLVIVRQNLWWALIYNAACVPLAVVGMLPAWLAGLGMAASSLLVVLNALRLARVLPLEKVL